MSQPLWIVELLKRNFRLRFFGAEMTKWPLIDRMMERALFNGHGTGDALFYLPKDRVVINQKIEPGESQAVPSAIVTHFIKEASHIFLMDKCICREAADCVEHDHGIGCIFLGEAVLAINPKLGRMVDKDTALAHVARARDAGLVHLIGRDKMDSMWLGAKPSTKLMTICNCCSCCCLFKFLPNLAPRLQKKVERMPWVNIEVSEDCSGCGICTKGVCFIDAIRIENGRAVIGEDCRGCGNCADVCPRGAIKINIEKEDYIENAIRRLSQAVDVR